MAFDEKDLLTEDALFVWGEDASVHCRLSHVVPCDPTDMADVHAGGRPPPAAGAAGAAIPPTANDAPKLGAWGKPAPTNAWHKGSPAKPSTPEHQQPAPAPAQPAARKSWAEMAKVNQAQDKPSSPVDKACVNAEVAAAQRPTPHITPNARAQPAIEQANKPQPQRKASEVSSSKMQAPNVEAKSEKKDDAKLDKDEEATIANLGKVLNAFC